MTLRKTLLSAFPFLRPLHALGRRFLYRTRLRLDKNRYADGREACLLPHRLCRFQSVLINPLTGYPLEYQRNKVHNLRLACPTADHLLIRPGETFSFWHLVGQAERMGRFRDGLCLVNGEIRPVRGGGLCQLSNLLYGLFLHTPLTVTERHPHSAESFPPPPVSLPHAHEALPDGVDATVSEGWLDLKAHNGTETTFQIVLHVEGDHLRGEIRTDRQPEAFYRVWTEDESIQEETDGVYRSLTLWRARLDPLTGEETEREKLYDSRQRLDYPIQPEPVGGEEVA
ncbi:MAG: VanW family protein [Clostridiales bacterium]|nr:VanW family protein [Clostridiales bacterium]